MADIVVNGTNGSETLAGGAGDDSIYGLGGQDTLTGGRGNDLMNGGTGADTYRFARGDGQDVLYDEGSSGQTDTLAFGAGILAGRTTVSQADNGRDLLIRFTGSTDQVTLDNAAYATWARLETVTFEDGTVWTYADLFAKATAGTNGDDRYWGDERGNRFATGLGNDTVDGGYGNDTLNGGRGSDSLNGGVGLDTYEFIRGDGQDVIYDEGSNGETDTLALGTGILPTRVTVMQADNGRDLVLTFTGTTDRVTLDNVAYSTYARIEQVTFSDGTVWSYADLFAKATAGTNGADQFWGDERGNAIDSGLGNDTIHGGYGNDTLNGGKANDSVNGGVGQDTYAFTRGDGQDVFYDEGSNGEVDTLALRTGIIPSRVNVAQGDNGRDIVLTFDGTTDKVTLDNVGYSTYARIEQVTFQNGTVWSYADLFDRATTATNGADQFWGDERANALGGGIGHDTLTGGYGDDTLTGGRNNDSLNGGVGLDTYRFEAGDGQDTIYDEGSNGENDRLVLGGIDSDEVTVTQADNGRDLVIRVNGSTDSITLDNVAYSTYARIESVEFDDRTLSYADLFDKATAPTTGADKLWGDERANALSGGNGHDTLLGGYGNDTLDGDRNNDLLNGGVGLDTYRFEKGDGQDVIYDEGSNGENDTLLLGTGIAAARTSVAYGDSGRDLVLTFAGTTDKVTLDNVVSSSYARIETVQFQDGTVWSYEQLVQMADEAAGTGLWGL